LLLHDSSDTVPPHPSPLSLPDPLPICQCHRELRDQRFRSLQILVSQARARLRAVKVRFLAAAKPFEIVANGFAAARNRTFTARRSEEHTAELQSLTNIV